MTSNDVDDDEDGELKSDRVAASRRRATTRSRVRALRGEHTDAAVDDDDVSNVIEDVSSAATVVR